MRGFYILSTDGPVTVHPPSTVQPNSTSTTSSYQQSQTTGPATMYTMSECVYYVSTSSSQQAMYGMMGTSLIINFGLLVWWLRLCLYKRKHRPHGSRDSGDEVEVEKMPKPHNWECQIQRTPTFTQPKIIDASMLGTRKPQIGRGSSLNNEVRRISNSQLEQPGSLNVAARRVRESHENPEDTCGEALDGMGMSGRKPEQGLESILHDAETTKSNRNSRLLKGRSAGLRARFDEGTVPGQG